MVRIVLGGGLVLNMKVVSFQAHQLFFETIIDMVTGKDKEIVAEAFYLLHISSFQPHFHEYFLYNFFCQPVIFQVKHGHIKYLLTVMPEYKGISLPVARGNPR